MPAVAEINITNTSLPIDQETFRAATDQLRILLDGVTPNQYLRILAEEPEINRLRLIVSEFRFGYRNTADLYRSQLTRAQRKTGVRFPYKGPDGKRHQVGATRSTWLCWLLKRASDHSLPKALAERISAEYHGLTLAEYRKACSHG